MIRYFKRLAIRNIVSPYGLAMLSYCIFLFAWLFPPGLYTGYVREPDLMFLDPSTFIFYTSCVMAFLLGVRTNRFLGNEARTKSVVGISVHTPFLYLCVPVLLGTVCCCIYLKLLGGKINLLGLLAAQDGNAIKMAGQVGQLETGRWSSSLLMLTAILWWASFRAKQLRLKGAAKNTFRILFLLGVLVDTATCVATVDRTNLMPLIAGLAVVFLFSRASSENVKLYKITLFGLGSMAVVVAFFFAIAVLRGDAALRLLIMGFLGYTIVSYNRMAALLLGVMHDSYEGRGAFLFPFLRAGYFDSLFHLSNRFNWPSSFSVWLSAFGSVSSAGLNPAFNFYSTFGDLYSDLGWLALVYLFVLGVSVGYLWSRFRAGKTFALVLYPWCAFWILFWPGFNILFDVRALEITKMALALVVYDQLRIRYVRETAETEATTASGLSLFEPAATGLEGRLL